MTILALYTYNRGTHKKCFPLFITLTTRFSSIPRWCAVGESPCIDVKCVTVT